MADGLFVVIEGSDGSGKSTQQKQLIQRLEQSGMEVVTFDFPRYKESSSYFVRQYLSGEYGNVDDIDPHTAAMFFALDRYEAARDIRKALEDGKIVVCDRFVGSNMAHQGGKIATKEQRLGFYTWLDQLEFDRFEIPRPDVNIILNVPVNVSKELINKRGADQDAHEKSSSHLENAVRAYQEIGQLFPKNFQIVNCAPEGELLSVDEVNNLVWEKLEPKLSKKANPPVNHHKQGGKSPKKDNPYIQKNDNGSYSITQEGHAFLEEAVTNSDKNVYVFKDKLSNMTVAAAMARLSRRGDDMRITILDEFAAKAGKDEDLLRRVITAYGDDSVQQLSGIHLVVENASNLLTKKLEWGRLAAYLEQSTRYIFFDQKDEKGNYKYFTPKNLGAKTARMYEEKMDQIFDLYSQMVRELTKYVRDNSNTPQDERDGAWKGATRAQACDAIRPVLPVATKATVGIFASGQALESLIMHLLSEDIEEFRNTGQAMLEEAREVVPVLLERADRPDRGGAAIAYSSNTRKNVKKLANNLPQLHSSEFSSVELVDYFPKNELSIVPHVLYEHSSLSLNEIEQAIDEWKYGQKAEALETYIGERLNRRHKPGRAFEIPHYTFDLVCDYGIFRDLQRHRMVDDMRWQELTPRYGYEMPKLVEDAGLEDLFEQCFDISYELYSELVRRGYNLEAQYATLLGHRMRWKVTMNAREAYHFMELRTSPQGHPGYRKLTQEMYEALANVHPIIASGMRFVNQGEDPELTRLAAEKYTQFKLQQLDKVEKTS